MKNIHILPTDKPRSRLYTNNGNLHLDKDISKSIGLSENQNIYITNDEEIKEGDWFLCLDNRKCNDSIYKANEAWLNMEEKQPSYCKKVILTTDQDLIKDGVQAIDDEFLEWFVKNPSCEEVDVDNEPFDITEKGEWLIEYKPIIPKEEPKQECLVTKCMQLDAEIAYKSLLKQETLEEFAERMAVKENKSSLFELAKKYIALGAKWQQEQNGLTPNDLIEFSKWVNKMGYSHRLTIIPNDLIGFYLKNRENIIKLNLE